VRYQRRPVETLYDCGIPVWSVMIMAIGSGVTTAGQVVIDDSIYAGCRDQFAAERWIHTTALQWVGFSWRGPRSDEA
jgi:hypothetical protein